MCCCTGCCIRSGRTVTLSTWNSRPGCWAVTVQSVWPTGKCKSLLNVQRSTEKVLSSCCFWKVENGDENWIHWGFRRWVCWNLLFVNKSHKKTKLTLTVSYLSLYFTCGSRFIISPLSSAAVFRVRLCLGRVSLQQDIVSRSKHGGGLNFSFYRKDSESFVIN